MFPGEDAFESDNCRLTTTIGLGVVAMGASVSSRGAVNSSVQREREREREGMEGGAFKPKLRRYVVKREENYKQRDVNVLSSWAKAQKGPLGQ